MRYIGVSNENCIWRNALPASGGQTRSAAYCHHSEPPYSLLNRSFEVGLAEVSQYEGVELLGSIRAWVSAHRPGKYLNGAKPSLAHVIRSFKCFTRYSGEQTQKAVAAYVDIARRHGLDPAQMACSPLYAVNRLLPAPCHGGDHDGAAGKTNVESLHLELSEDVLAEIEAVHQVYTYPAP
ncbi:hypothetical protein MJ524_23265 [Escherichia coli]|nr:hypothetical protein MJ524_23265 [Escherichia coli]